MSALTTALLLLSTAAAPATPEPRPLDALIASVVPIELPNGFRFLFVPRPGTGVFAGNLRVKVGGADEEPGATGVAHLFEHMAFKGTAFLGTTDFEAESVALVRVHDTGAALAAERAKGDRADPKRLEALAQSFSDADGTHRAFVVKDELTALLLGNGAANLNATTDKDLTSYFVSLPKNRLELWALLEAQRFTAPVLREYYSERDVVMEERRMRTDTSPGGLLYEALNAAAFDASPYAWPTVGWMRDLEGLTIADSMALHRKAYVPGNAVGAIVGDLTEAEVREVLAKTFGAIPAGPVPPPLRGSEPPMRGERRRTVRYDAKPQLMLGFPKPTLPHRDDFVFDVIDQLLSGGRSARLTRRLVTEKKLAAGVGTFGAPGSRLANLFAVSAVPLPGISLDALERETQVVLDELALQPIPPAELDGARRRMEADFLRSLATNEGIASTLTYYDALTGDFRYVAEHGRAIATIDAAEVQRVAKLYLGTDRRVSVHLVPTAKEVTP